MNLFSARARRSLPLLLLLALSGALRPVSAQDALRPPPAPPLAAEKAIPEQTAPEKRSFHLFQPTPRAALRDLSADRPDTTESPITVDAGRWQIEASFFDYGRDETRQSEEEVFTYGAINLKAGLLHNVDLQLVFDAYTVQRTRDRRAGTTSTVEGLSDPQLRLKINLWGNDAGRTAFAFFPYLKIPSGSELSNDQVEGGIILPFSIELNDRWSLGLMAETDFVHDDEARHYETEFVHTAVLGHSLTEKIGVFLEYVGVLASNGSAYQAGLSAGLTYGLTADVQLDLGGRAGLNAAAEDGGIFTGITMRF